MTQTCQAFISFRFLFHVYRNTEQGKTMKNWLYLGCWRSCCIGSCCMCNPKPVSFKRKYLHCSSDLISLRHVSWSESRNFRYWKHCLISLAAHVPTVAPNTTSQIWRSLSRKNSRNHQHSLNQYHSASFSILQCQSILIVNTHSCGCSRGIDTQDHPGLRPSQPHLLGNTTHQVQLVCAKTFQNPDYLCCEVGEHGSIRLVIIKISKAVKLLSF